MAKKFTKFDALVWALEWAEFYRTEEDEWFDMDEVIAFEESFVPALTKGLYGEIRGSWLPLHANFWFDSVLKEEYDPSKDKMMLVGRQELEVPKWYIELS